MEKEFVLYEQALAFKELGFDEPCFGYYDTDGLQVSTHYWYPKNKNTSFPESQTTNNPKISAPTFSQAFRWFRKKYDLYSFVFKFDEGFGYETYKEGVTQTNDSFDTYEEAELACLDKLIEITKNK